MAPIEKTYEAWIEARGRMETRTVIVRAESERAAFRLARTTLEVDEFVRGVVEVVR